MTLPEKTFKSEFEWSDSKLTKTATLLLPHVINFIEFSYSNLINSSPKFNPNILDIGCGNGSVDNYLTHRGYSVVGVDPSHAGIEIAKREFPKSNFMIGSTDDSDFIDRFGGYPFVISLEVIEHTYSPRKFCYQLFEVLNPGGIVIISTPFHGYWKNLAIALLGRSDNHYTALWEHGHIKFFSVRTLFALLSETGFIDIKWKVVGRIQPLGMSMIFCASKPRR